MGNRMAVTQSAAETRALGERLAGQLKPGDVVLLEGELGAGKSELARGIARGLGVTETVTSPSFTILNVYESGRCPLYHFDWYRLESEEELYELGMDEYEVCGEKLYYYAHGRNDQVDQALVLQHKDLLVVLCEEVFCYFVGVNGCLNCRLVGVAVVLHVNTEFVIFHGML